MLNAFLLHVMNVSQAKGFESAICTKYDLEYSKRTSACLHVLPVNKVSPTTNTQQLSLSLLVVRTQGLIFTTAALHVMHILFIMWSYPAEPHNA